MPHSTTAGSLEPMAQELPFIDRHTILVDADRETVWRALTDTFGDSGGKLFTAYARLIGVDPDSNEGRLDQVGSTRIGFRVSGSKPAQQLELTGSHRFSTYSLTWDITEEPFGKSRLSATTNAKFPGIHGRAYKAAVIDSSAHARVTRRMLKAVRHRATRG